MQQPVQQCSSHTRSPSDPTAQEMDESSIPAALVSKSSDILMLLLSGFPVLTRALPMPRVQPSIPLAALCRDSPGDRGLCAAGVAGTALTQPDCSCASPSLHPLCPSRAPNRARLRVPLGSGRVPGKQRCCAGTAALSHAGRSSARPGQGARLLQPCRDPQGARSAPP